MRAVVQRVRRGSVSIDGDMVARIDRGLVILIGVGEDDGSEDARWLAEKIACLRIFEDEKGKSNLSLIDVGGQALVVSQFTLYADTSRGRRPSFIKAAPPEIAERLVAQFVTDLSDQGVHVQTGSFGAHMLVEIENDGPVTILLERGSEGVA
jgi:D-tyrosyl-tRNA(Tyr) deacylase